MEEPDFWDNPERSQQHMKTLSDLKEDVATYKQLTDQYEEIELMIEMGYEENDPEIVPEIQEMLHLLRRANANINQIARHLHDTGRIYDTDLEEILGFQKETATRLNDILTKLSALK